MDNATTTVPQLAPNGPAAKPGFVKRRWVQLLGVGLGAFLLGMVTGVSGDTAPSKATASIPASTAASTAPVVESPAPVETPTPEPPAVTPVPADFKVTLKVLEKKCFGSAGCNVSYRPQLAYGGLPLESGTTWEVTYSVKGAEDPIVGTLTVDGTSVSGPEEESTSTKSAGAKLVATVTSVESVG